VGFEVFIAVVMYSSIFWDITNEPFRGTCFHLQSGRVRQAISQHKEDSKLSPGHEAEIKSVTSER
jgi:hypothetical protein